MAGSQTTKKTVRLTPNELRALAYVATLFVATIAMVMGVESAVVWTFLGVAVGRTLPDLGK